jgi:hypothetical protein
VPVTRPGKAQPHTRGWNRGLRSKQLAAAKSVEEVIPLPAVSVGSDYPTGGLYDLYPEAVGQELRVLQEISQALRQDPHRGLPPVRQLETEGLVMAPAVLQQASAVESQTPLTTTGGKQVRAKWGSKRRLLTTVSKNQQTHLADVLERDLREGGLSS